MLIKFKNLSLERKLLALFILICISLPFSVARSPIEIFSRSIPLWSTYLLVSFWFADGKNFWEGLLACYGITTVELLFIYFGTFGFRISIGKFFSWIKKQLKKGVVIPISGTQLILIKNMRKRSGYDSVNNFTKNKKQKFANWLSRRGTGMLLFIIFLPIPWSDLLATAILGTRKIKYGHWRIAAVNIPHMLMIIYLVFLGTNLLDLLRKLFS